MKKFDDLTIQNIQYYVYLLKDPRNWEIFYVGKGRGNRVFQHVQDALEDNKNTDKLDRIRDIINVWLEVDYQLLRHWITEDVAFEVESAFIDYLWIENLTNLVLWTHSSNKWLMSINEIIQVYGWKKVDIIDSVILININKLFRRNMTEQDLYEATRKSRVVWEKRNNAKYAFAHYKWIIREVYEIFDWYPIETEMWKIRRWFNGKVASSDARNKYINGLVPEIKRGAANPIKYMNCW